MLRLNVDDPTTYSYSHDSTKRKKKYLSDLKKPRRKMSTRYPTTPLEPFGAYFHRTAKANPTLLLVLQRSRAMDQSTALLVVVTVPNLPYIPVYTLSHLPFSILSLTRVYPGSVQTPVRSDAALPRSSRSINSCHEKNYNALCMEISWTSLSFT